MLQLGCGSWGAGYAAALAERGALAGLVVRTERSAQALSQSFRVPIGCDREALAAQVRPDAVVVATPTEQHAQDVHWALARGLPTLVLKPVASDAAHAVALAARARAAGVALTVAHEVLANPSLAALLGVLERAEIGPLERAEILRAGRERGRDGGPPRPMPEGPRFRRMWLEDTAIHEAVLACRLAGRRAPSAVEVSDFVLTPDAVTLHATWRFDDGFSVALRYDSRASRDPEQRVEVDGAAGAVGVLATEGRAEVWLRDVTGEPRSVPRPAGIRGGPIAACVTAWLATVRGEAPDAGVRLDDADDSARAQRAALALVRAALDAA